MGNARRSATSVAQTDRSASAAGRPAALAFLGLVRMREVDPRGIADYIHRQFSRTRCSPRRPNREQRVSYLGASCSANLGLTLSPRIPPTDKQNQGWQPSRDSASTRG